MNRLAPEPLVTVPCPEIRPGDAPDHLRDESRLAAPGVRTIFRPTRAAELADAFGQLARRGERAVLSGGRTGIAGGAVPIDAQAVVTLAAMNRVRALGRDADGPYLRVEPGVTLAQIAELLRTRRLPAGIPRDADVPGVPEAPDPLTADGPGADASDAPDAGWLAPADPTARAAERAFARRYLGERAGPPCWLPVDPTEQTAHVGGAVAANASGARTFRYGPMRDWVRALAVVLPDGRLLRLRRGGCRAEDGVFRLARPDGGDAAVVLPRVDEPACKHSLGYAAGASLDAVDLFVGSEGTLGAVVEVELALAYAPVATLGAVCVVPDEAAAVAACRAARAAFGSGAGARVRVADEDDAAGRRGVAGPRGPRPPGVDGAVLAAIEYFSPEALRLLREERVRQAADGGAPSLPALPGEEGAAVYFEFAAERGEDADGDAQVGADVAPGASSAPGIPREAGTEAGEARRTERAEASLLGALEILAGWLEAVGADPDDTWVATDPEALARQKAFRHAVPELVNNLVARRQRDLSALHKVGTDMAVPDDRLEAAMKLYRDGLAESGLEAVLFGHLGDNHLHVNLLPRTADELVRAKELYRAWAARIAAMGGAVAAEHGIGRLKAALFAQQYPGTVLAAWRAVRRAFDPGGLLGPGVLV